MNEKQVITVIANPAIAPLDDTVVSAVKQALLDHQAKILHSEWLAQNAAYDIIFMSENIDAAEAAARAALGEAPFDLIAQEAGTRRKQLLISDMDSTIITIECIDEIADFAGIKPQVATITERAMRGELDFKDALEERVALLAGLPETALQQVVDERLMIMPGAKALVQTMRANGAYCVLVSGGFTYFTAHVRDDVGFHVDFSNRLEIAEGKLTGKVLAPILDKNAKLETLLTTCAERHISLSDTLAVGDGANDLPMLMSAGLGVAYHAKPLVQQSARARINHTDLSALLYAQGYRAEEITA